MFKPIPAIFKRPLAWWEWALIAFVVVWAIAAFVLTGWMADTGATPLLAREWFIRLRFIPMFAIVFLLFRIRGQPWWRYVAGVLFIVGLFMNIARNEVDSKAPLTVSFAILLIAICFEFVPMALRLAPSERVQEASQSAAYWRKRALKSETEAGAALDRAAACERKCEAKDDELALKDGLICKQADTITSQAGRINLLSLRLEAAGIK